MQPLHVDTPLWESPPLSAALGIPVLLKMDAFQPAASFKIRGMGRLCQHHYALGATNFVCASGGNAGLAVAYAARKLGATATIVVPQRTSARARDLIRSEGATVIEHGAVWDEAHTHALTLATAADTAYIHPFDEPLIWQGHASLIEEVAAISTKPGAVVVSVGGGGLLCGVAEGMQRVSWGDVPILAVETAGAASFAAALAAGEPVRLDTINSVAVTLSARTVTAGAVEWAQRHAITPWLVSDRAAVDACLRFLDDHRVLVEPACGAALAAVYDHAVPLQGCTSVLVVVCGGAGVNLALLEQWNADLR